MPAGYHLRTHQAALCHQCAGSTSFGMHAVPLAMREPSGVTSMYPHLEILEHSRCPVREKAFGVNVLRRISCRQIATRSS